MDAVQVPVFIQSWQHECCGTMFAIGSHVAWFLGVDPDGFWARALGEKGPSWSRHLPVISRVEGLKDEPENFVVGTDGLRVFVQWDSYLAPTPQGVTVPGPLVEDHHIDVPAEATPTRGVVRRVRTVHQGYLEGMPRPGDAALADVVEVQRWNPDDEVRSRRFVGFLVDLDVEH